PARRRHHLCRHRLPLRRRKPRRAAPHLRPRGRHPAARRPELLPPRHRVRRARLRGRSRIRGLPARRVRRREPRDPRAAVPGCGARHRHGRRGARPQLVQRWAQRRDRLACHRLRAAADRARLHPARRRPLRAAARRWRREVLHPGVATMTANVASATARYLEQAEQFGAHNYHPLPVVVAEAFGAWVTDVDGKRYLDCLAAYSALNFGHGHPVLVDAAKAQLERLTLTSRAFHNDKLGPFLEALAKLAGKEMVLPMNTGAEAVESAVKIARAWGYRVKGVEHDRAKIIVADGNFHGRTTTIISFSNEQDARAYIPLYTPGFVSVPYGDAAAIAAAIDDDTVAVLLEPIQGEAGIVIPPDDYLPAVRRLTRDANVLFIADEIQSGLGRTGATFQCDNAGVIPDLY